MRSMIDYQKVAEYCRAQAEMMQTDTLVDRDALSHVEVDAMLEAARLIKEIADDVENS